MEHLFVYGTLAPGRSNEHVLAVIPGTWQSATVRGHLLPRGWGAAEGFPAIRLDPTGPAVTGVLFGSDVLDQHWDQLDDFEGDGYRRTTVEATTDGGRRVTAQIYALREDV